MNSMGQFPLVSDEEVMLVAMPQMNLYDENELVSNIKGDFEDRNYVEWDPIVAGNPVAHTLERRDLDGQVRESEKTYAELAREQARADLKKKRSAAYLKSDLPQKMRKTTSKPFTKSKEASKEKPTAFFQKEEAGDLMRLGQNLKQDKYILLDLEESQPLLTEGEKKDSKNSYDFLKRSQIYNPQDKRTAVKRSQELNLTQFDQG